MVPPAPGKIVLIVEYDGTDYCGFQLQSGQTTIQEKIEEAIFRLTGEHKRIIAASRTDSGVHAREQVVSFLTASGLPKQAFVRGLNHYLPQDIAVKAAYKVNRLFDVRRRAVKREYIYYILNSENRSPLRRRSSYRVRGTLDTGAMNEACEYLLGEHDFASFVTGGRAGLKTVKRVYRAAVQKEEDMVQFYITANSFLPHQVRNTVGSLIKVGLGRMKAEEFYSIIEAKKPGLAGPTAPACGLFLNRIEYPAPWSEIDEDL